MSAIFNQGPINNTLINAVATATVTPQMNGTVFICTKLGAGDSTITLPDPTIATSWPAFSLYYGADCSCCPCY